MGPGGKLAIESFHGASGIGPYAEARVMGSSFAET
jgi:hypothetical protein